MLRRREKPGGCWCALPASALTSTGCTGGRAPLRALRPPPRNTLLALRLLVSSLLLAVGRDDMSSKEGGILKKLWA